VAPQFTQEAILSARESLPVSRLVGLEALRLLDKENVSLDALERVLKGDPVLSAHLIRVANSALMSYGTETRTVNQAIGRIGMERTKLHLWGLAVKRMFQSPALQKIWNHSILAAQVSRQLAEMTHVIPPDEASLIALVHDIGQIVLVNLGASYERARTQRLARGLFPVQAEQQLCGATHAGVGADLLAYWKFAPDMVEAVRFHHSPTDKTSPLAALLYVAETWLDSQEDLCDLTLHRACMRRLGLTSADLQTVGVKHSPDLELLRFAA
jgi:HD-like signal output (HDOD) protein